MKFDYLDILEAYSFWGMKEFESRFSFDEPSGFSDEGSMSKS